MSLNELLKLSQLLSKRPIPKLRISANYSSNWRTWKHRVDNLLKKVKCFHLIDETIPNPFEQERLFYINHNYTLLVKKVLNRILLSLMRTNVQRILRKYSYQSPKDLWNATIKYFENCEKKYLLNQFKFLAIGYFEDEDSTSETSETSETVNSTDVQPEQQQPTETSTMNPTDTDNDNPLPTSCPEVDSTESDESHVSVTTNENNDDNDNNDNNVTENAPSATENTNKESTASTSSSSSNNTDSNTNNNQSKSKKKSNQMAFCNWCHRLGHLENKCLRKFHKQKRDFNKKINEHLKRINGELPTQ